MKILHFLFFLSLFTTSVYGQEIDTTFVGKERLKRQKIAK